MIRFNTTRLDGRLSKTAYLIVGMLPTLDGEIKILRFGIMATVFTRTFALWWGK
jgi:hypothetical protein